MNIIKPVSQAKTHASASEIAPTLAERFEIPAAPSETEKLKRSHGRLFSLDFLRGADIFFLTVLSVILAVVNQYCPLPSILMDQLVHPEWVGFTAYDMIMPLFIFMCGAALPLALPKYLDDEGHAGIDYWSKVIKRVAMLWILGMIAQGELFSYDLHRISFFNNTLQTIAVGYFVTAIVARIPSKVVQIAIPFLLAAGYTAFLHLCGDMTPTGNAAVVYEVKFLQLFYPNATPMWHPVKQILDWHYTWWTSIPMFAVMGLAGYHATEILLVEKWDKKRKSTVQMAVGLGLVVLGVGLVFFDPCVKHIYTASFTSIAMGVSFILYSFCYTIFDIRGWRLGTSIIQLFGKHSLLAYMLVETCFQVALKVLPDTALVGLKSHLTEAQYGIIEVLLKSATLIFILYVWDWYKRGKTAAAKAEKAALEAKKAELGMK